MQAYPKLFARHRWLLLLVVAALLMPAFVGSATAGDNLLTNPGFETGDLGAWKTSARGIFRVDSEPEPVQEGKNQLFVQANHEDEPHYAFVYQDVPGQPGQTYTASVCARSHGDISPTMEIGLGFLAADGKLLSKVISQKMSTDYMELTVTETAPEGTVKVRIDLLVYSTPGNNGEANFDEASLVVEGGGKP